MSHSAADPASVSVAWRWMLSPGPRSSARRGEEPATCGSLISSNSSSMASAATSGATVVGMSSPALPALASAPSPRLHRGDQLVDAVVVGAERVLAQDRALRLVVQLQVHPVDRVVAPPLLGLADELAPQPCPRGLGRLLGGAVDGAVVADPLHGAAALQRVVEPALAVHVVVGEVDQRDLGVRQRQAVAGPRPLDQQVLGHPVHLAADRVEVLLLERVEHLTPHVDDLLGGLAGVAPVHEAGRLLEVLALDLERARLPVVGQPDLAPAAHVMGDLADRADRVVERQVAQDGGLLDHGEHQVGGAHLEERRPLGHVRVAHDDVQAAVALGVGGRLFAGVDNRPRAGGRRGDALPDVPGPLGDAVHRAPRGGEHLAGAAEDLAADDERDQHVRQALELAVARHQVVLVAAVGVAGRVGVVLEQEDLAGDALFVQAGLGGGQQALEDALAGLVVGDQLEHRVALGRGVLGVGADVQVQPGAVLEEHVGRPSPRHHPAEQVAGDLVRGQPALPTERAGNPVLVLEAKDAPVHWLILLAPDRRVIGILGVRGVDCCAGRGQRSSVPRMTRPNPPEPPPGGTAEREQREAEPRLRPMVLFRWGIFVSLGVIATLAAATAVYTARTVLIRASIALFVAISLDPAVRWLVRRGMRRGLAVTLIFVLALGLVAAFLVSVIPAMVEQFRQLVHDLPGYLSQLQARSARFRELSDRFNLTRQIQSLISGAPARLGGGLLGFTGRLFGALFSTLTVLVLTIYFMADLPRLRHGLVRLFPRGHRAQLGRMVDVVIDKVGDYMIGNLLISLVAGLASFVAFIVLGMPFSVPLAFVVALCDLIPMIGATLGAVIAVLLALFATDLWPTTVLVAAFFVVYQQLENYLIAPRILRSTVNLSAAAVLLAGLIGATALGLVGALMAIPVAAALKVLLSEQLQTRSRRRRQRCRCERRERVRGSGWGRRSGWGRGRRRERRRGAGLGHVPGTGRGRSPLARVSRTSAWVQASGAAERGAPSPRRTRSGKAPSAVRWSSSQPSRRSAPARSPEAMAASANDAVAGVQ